MALLTSHSSVNRVQYELPHDHTVKWYYTNASLQPKEVSVRTEYERWGYVGMTQAAAQACVQDMYDTYQPEILTPGVEVSVLPRATNAGGRMWNVEVTWQRITMLEMDVE